MKKSIRIPALVFLMAGLLVVAGYAYHRHRYPYGSSHCCSLAVGMALAEYADRHGGRFPSGESSPEASLSLLYREGLAHANTLRGMTVPEKITRHILEGGGLLGPESCGWHYVEGLTQSDDPALALLWCKEPLRHDGSRGPRLEREVIRVDGSRSSVPMAGWPAFLETQMKLLAARTPREKNGEPLVRAMIVMPDHHRIEAFDGPYRLSEETRSATGSGSGSSSGRRLNPSDLVWFRAPVQDGVVTRVLRFSNLKSEPVTVVFSGGVPDVNQVEFRMSEVPDKPGSAGD